MVYVQPLRQDQIDSDVHAFAKQAYASFGFVPNTILTMAYRPTIARAFLGLVQSVMSDTLDPTLRTLIAQIASTAAGCRYCQAHAAHQALIAGVAVDKIAAAWAFETDTRFTPAERAALRLARDGAVVPNAITPLHFAELDRYFDEGSIVEIVAIIALMGFLNRWNDTLATTLEETPLHFVEQQLTPHNWIPGKHRSEPTNHESDISYSQ